jgi:hypothetical protein
VPRRFVGRWAGFVRLDDRTHLIDQCRVRPRCIQGRHCQRQQLRLDPGRQCYGLLRRRRQLFAAAEPFLETASPEGTGLSCAVMAFWSTR